jgi:hypothetical protein
MLPLGCAPKLRSRSPHGLNGSFPLKGDLKYRAAYAADVPRVFVEV